MIKSSLATIEHLSKAYNKRTQKISKITIHHAAGKLKAKRIAEILANRNVSANYTIGFDGEVCCGLSEDLRAWTSSSAWNDQRAITIEVSNDGGADTDWHVSDASIDALVNLCVDICKRNDIKTLEFTGDKNGSLTIHQLFVATTCPGPYLKSQLGNICERVNAQLAPAETPKEETAPAKLSAAELAEGMKRGDYGNGAARKNKLKSLGYTDAEIQAAQDIVNGSAAKPAAPAKKSADEIAAEIIAGKWGNGSARTTNLKSAGYTDAEIAAAQGIVNEKLRGGTSSPSLKNGDIVKFKSSAAKWATGQTIPSWVKSRTLYVRSTPSDGKVSVSTLKIGAITGVAYVDDLNKA